MHPPASSDRPQHTSAPISRHQPGWAVSQRAQNAHAAAVCRTQAACLGAVLTAQLPARARRCFAQLLFAVCRSRPQAHASGSEDASTRPGRQRQPAKHGQQTQTSARGSTSQPGKRSATPQGQPRLADATPRSALTACFCTCDPPAAEAEQKAQNLGTKHKRSADARPTNTTRKRHSAPAARSQGAQETKQEHSTQMTNDNEQMTLNKLHLTK